MAEIKGAILVSFDGDMRVLAQGHGVTASRFKKLSILKLSCFEPDAADRVKSALSLIDHEWRHNKASKGDRIFIDIGKSIIRTCR